MINLICNLLRSPSVKMECGSQICSGMSHFLGCVGAWFDLTMSKNVHNQSTLFTSHGSNGLTSFEEVL
jgi:hypothetical protein